MKTGWTYKIWGLHWARIHWKKGNKSDWGEDWPPVKVRILTDEEYQELLRKALPEDPKKIED